MLIEKTRLGLLLYQRKEIQTNKANKVMPVSFFNLFQAVLEEGVGTIFQPYGYEALTSCLNPASSTQLSVIQ